MVHGTSGAVKVIDPEFCVYGPPGLDVGSLISGLVLAAIRHIFKAQPDFAAAWRMAEAIDMIWKTYAGVLAKQGLSAEVIEGINSDTVGFACCEVLRTALGFAGARGLKFEDKDKERQAQDVVVELVTNRLQMRWDDDDDNDEDLVGLLTQNLYQAILRAGTACFCPFACLKPNTSHDS